MKALQDEFGDDVEVKPIADPGTTGNFEVTVDGTVRSPCIWMLRFVCAASQQVDRNVTDGVAGALLLLAAACRCLPPLPGAADPL